MNKLIHLLLCTTFLFVATTIFAADPPERNEYGKIVRNISYGDARDNSTKLDLYLSANASPDKPFVILLHGGAYMDGSKSELEDVAKVLMTNDISSIVVNYHLLSKRAVKGNNDATYNTMLLDVWRAIQYAQLRSDDWNIRKSNYILMGEEVGGHLALLAGYKFHETVEKIIAIGALTDLRDISAFHRIRSSERASRILFTKLMGDIPYHDEKEVPADYINASPVLQLRNVPTLLVHGVQDPVIPYSQAAKMYKALQERHIPSRIVNIEDGGKDLIYNPMYKDYIIQQVLQWIYS